MSGMACEEGRWRSVGRGGPRRGSGSGSSSAQEEMDDAEEDAAAAACPRSCATLKFVGLDGISFGSLE